MSGHRIFEFDKIGVFFKHTDYHANTHPYNYFEWMSFAREAYFQELVPNFYELCQKSIRMVTANVELSILEDAKFGDHVRVQIYSQFVKRLSFEVVFYFYRMNDNKCLASGKQRLTFLDSFSGKPTLIPQELKEVVLQFENKINN